MPISILGQHISVVRPAKIHKPQVPKQCFVPKYNKHPKTLKISKRELQELVRKYEEELNDTRKV